MLAQPADAAPLLGEVAGCNLPAGGFSGVGRQWISNAAAIPEARPLSATSHWRSGIAVMFMP